MTSLVVANLVMGVTALPQHWICCIKERQHLDITFFCLFSCSQEMMCPILFHIGLFLHSSPAVFPIERKCRYSEPYKAKWSIGIFE